MHRGELYQIHCRDRLTISVTCQLLCTSSGHAQTVVFVQFFRVPGPLDFRAPKLRGCAKMNGVPRATSAISRTTAGTTVRQSKGFRVLTVGDSLDPIGDLICEKELRRPLARNPLVVRCDRSAGIDDLGNNSNRDHISVVLFQQGAGSRRELRPPLNEIHERQSHTICVIGGRPEVAESVLITFR